MKSVLEQLNCLSLHDHVESHLGGDEEMIDDNDIIDEEMIDDNDIMLGFLNTIEDTKEMVAKGHLFLSKVGGYPNWLIPMNDVNTSTWSSPSFLCEICHGPLRFLMQVSDNVLKQEPTSNAYCILLVYICPNMKCLQQDQYEQCKPLEEKPCRSIKVVRNQLLEPTISSFSGVVHKGISSDFMWPEMELFFEREWIEDEVVNQECNLNSRKDRVQELLKDYVQKRDEEFTTIDMTEVKDSSLDEETWADFQMAVASAPEQVLRLTTSLDAKPLWVSFERQPNNSHIPPCPRCGKRRMFGLQIMPQLLSFLELDDGPNSLDWGTIVVYLCEDSCVIDDRTTSYVEEFVWVQLHSYSFLPGLQP